MTPVYRNTLPGSDAYHGYHTVDFYAVEPRLGTMQEFQRPRRRGAPPGPQGGAGPGGEPQRPAPSRGSPIRRRRRGGTASARTPRLRNNFDIAGLADPYARPKRRESPLDGWFAGNLPDLNQDDPLRQRLRHPERALVDRRDRARRASGRTPTRTSTGPSGSIGRRPSTSSTRTSSSPARSPRARPPSSRSSRAAPAAAASTRN